MDTIQIYNKCIIWTRSVALMLSIITVILSLSIYNYNALPILELIEETASPSALRGHQLLHDMIQDRRLIATLVAAQASVFCPLFLLMTTTSTFPIEVKTMKISRIEIWRLVIEQFCYFLMPFGLGLSWIFCIIFDKKTEAALLEYNYTTTSSSSCSSIWDLMVYLVDSLKYIVIGVLCFEILVICLSSFEYAKALFTSQAIQLSDEEDYLCDEQVEEQDEKAILYI